MGTIIDHVYTSIGDVTVYAAPADLFTDPTNRDLVYKEFRTLSSRTQEQYIVDKGYNLVVNGGLDQMANRILGLVSTTWTHIGVGTSGAANSPTQTNFDATQISPRLAVPTAGKTLEPTGKAHFDTTFATTDNNGTWAETGLFTAATGSVMMCRKVISPAFVKSSSNIAIVGWTIILTASGT